jgi:hypothetical protein
MVVLADFEAEDKPFELSVWISDKVVALPTVTEDAQAGWQRVRREDAAEGHVPILYLERGASAVCVVLCLCLTCPSLPDAALPRRAPPPPQTARRAAPLLPRASGAATPAEGDGSRGVLPPAQLVDEDEGSSPLGA